LRKGYVFSILLLTVIVSLPAVAQKRNRQFASWQGKWDDFVAEFNACMASKPCDPATRFYGKVVSWQGTVEKVTDVISVEMGPLRLNDREGKAGDSVTVLLFPAKGRGDTWKRATPGTAVTFRGKLPAKGSELGAVEFNSLGGKKFAFVQLVDAELLTQAVPPK
jgi:hypothetical protein